MLVTMLVSEDTESLLSIEVVAILVGISFVLTLQTMLPQDMSFQLPKRLVPVVSSLI